jgi:hypothetical protein
MFDANGEPFYISGAVKGTRHYRVSRKVVRGGADSGDRGWRPAALELEKTVTTAAQRLLSDPATLSGAVRTSQLSASDSQQLVTAAKRLATSCLSGCFSKPHRWGSGFSGWLGRSAAPRICL